MKYLIILFLLLILVPSTPTLLSARTMGLSVQEISTQGQAELPVGQKQQKKKHKSKKLAAPPKQKNPDLTFIRLAVYTALAIAITFLFMFSLPVLSVLVPFVVSLWFLSGVFATMSIILMLSKFQKNYRETNEAIAWYIMLLLILRIALIIALFFLLKDAISLALTLAVTFVPSFIIYVGAMLLLLSNNNTKSSKKNMF